MPFNSAVAVWQMDDGESSVGTGFTLTPTGKASLGIALIVQDQEYSRRRGGDGLAASFGGGYLSGHAPALSGEEFSVCVRLLDATQTGARPIISCGTPSAHAGFRLAVMEVNGVLTLVFDLEAGGKSSRVSVPVGQIGNERWHDIVVLLRATRLELFVDGKLIDKASPVSCPRLPAGAPLLIGAREGKAGIETGFLGLVDHLALWERAISDEEIMALSGGAEEAARRDSLMHVSELITHARELREKYQHDPHRPTYHVMGPEDYNVAFDPQGCIFWKGRYHIFYPYFPNGVGCWGHVSSRDLVHWTYHPEALGVHEGDPEKHVYAGGSLVNKDGVPTLMYHGVDSGTCIATSTDDGLIHWTKHSANPVIPLPKEGDPDYLKYHVWDCCGWVDGDYHYSLSGNLPGGKPKTDGDIAYLWRSRDMVQWEYRGPFYKSDRRWTSENEDCSCPDFFPLGNKHVLMFISHNKGTQYYIGRYENEKFYPERHARMTWPGGSTFAQETLLDDKGRRIFWAWVIDQRPQDSMLISGWNGVYTMPRVLSLAPDGTMRIEPAEELNVLRYDRRRHENLQIAADSHLVLKDVSGDCLELSLELDPTGVKEFGVKVRCSPDGEEQTLIIFDPAGKSLKVDTSSSTCPQFKTVGSQVLQRQIADGRQGVFVQVAPFELANGEPLKLRIFLDRSMLEIYANGRQCVTQRIYPSRSDSLGVALFSQGGGVTVSQLDAWKMSPSNPW